MYRLLFSQRRVDERAPRIGRAGSGERYPEAVGDDAGRCRRIRGHGTCSWRPPPCRRGRGRRTGRRAGDQCGPVPPPCWGPSARSGSSVDRRSGGPACRQWTLPRLSREGVLPGWPRRGRCAAVAVRRRRASRDHAWRARHTRSSRHHGSGRGRPRPCRRPAVPRRDHQGRARAGRRADHAAGLRRLPRRILIADPPNWTMRLRRAPRPRPHHDGRAEGPARVHRSMSSL